MNTSAIDTKVTEAMVNNAYAKDDAKINFTDNTKQAEARKAFRSGVGVALITGRAATKDDERGIDKKVYGHLLSDVLGIKAHKSSPKAKKATKYHKAKSLIDGLTTAEKVKLQQYLAEILKG